MPSHMFRLQGRKDLSSGDRYKWNFTKIVLIVLISNLTLIQDKYNIFPQKRKGGTTPLRTPLGWPGYFLSSVSSI